VHILGVSGSLSQRSANRSLLELCVSLVPNGSTFALAPALDALPHFNPELDTEPAAPAVAIWREQLRAADTVLIAAPEYGHGMPGVLKNALDWLVGSGEFVGKPVIATCAAQGKGRGLLGLASLVQTLRAIDAVVLSSYPVVVPRLGMDAEGSIVDAEVIAEARTLLDRLVRAAGKD
jgi:chromate reductase, NAD(P)H dehydrogenase (quinone)